MRKAEMRALLDVLIADHAAIGERLTELRREMHNRVGPRGRVVSRSMTPVLRGEILRKWAAAPELAQQEIADLFAVNIGRVSETLHGKRQ